MYFYVVGVRVLWFSVWVFVVKSDTSELKSFLAARCQQWASFIFSLKLGDNNDCNFFWLLKWYNQCKVLNRIPGMWNVHHYWLCYYWCAFYEYKTSIFVLCVFLCLKLYLCDISISTHGSFPILPFCVILFLVSLLCTTYIWILLFSPNYESLPLME